MEYLGSETLSYYTTSPELKDFFAAPTSNGQDDDDDDETESNDPGAVTRVHMPSSGPGGKPNRGFAYIVDFSS